MKQLVSPLGSFLEVSTFPRTFLFMPILRSRIPDFLESDQSERSIVGEVFPYVGPRSLHSTPTARGRVAIDKVRASITNELLFISWVFLTIVRKNQLFERSFRTCIAFNIGKSRKYWKK